MQASENVRDGASRAYDTTTGGWGSRNEDDRGIYDRARDAASRAGQATRDSTYRAIGYEDSADRSYASRAYDSVRGGSGDAYEAGKNRLGSIIEILGWHRAPEEDEPITARLGKYSSPYDVVVGNTRYVWHQKPDEPESYYQSAKNSVGSAAQTVTDKAREGANTVYDAAGRTKDVTVETVTKASEPVRDIAGKTGETVSEYSQKGKEAINAKAAVVEEKIGQKLCLLKIFCYESCAGVCEVGNAGDGFGDGGVLIVGDFGVQLSRGSSGGCGVSCICSRGA
jgi:hypothetical protein